MDKTLINIYVTNGTKIPRKQFDILPNSLKRTHVKSLLHTEKGYIDIYLLNYITDEEFKEYLREIGNIYNFKEIADNLSPNKLQIFVEDIINVCINNNGCYKIDGKIFQMIPNKLKPIVIVRILEPINFTELSDKKVLEFFNQLSLEQQIKTYKLYEEIYEDGDWGVDNSWAYKNIDITKKQLFTAMTNTENIGETILELIKNDIGVSEDIEKKLSDDIVKQIVFIKLTKNDKRTNGFYFLFKHEFNVATHPQKTHYIKSKLKMGENSTNNWFKLTPDEQNYLDNNG